MKYYEKQKGEEIFIMTVDDNGNYSIASNLDSDPDGFIAPADPFGRGYKECSKQRAEKILGYKDSEDSKAYEPHFSRNLTSSAFFLVPPPPPHK